MKFVAGFCAVGAVLFIGVVIVLAGEGYDSILIRNMKSAGLTDEEAHAAVQLPRVLEDVLVVNDIPFVPPCTLAIIAHDGLSGYTLIVRDTIPLTELFDLREKIKR